MPLDMHPTACQIDCLRRMRDTGEPIVIDKGSRWKTPSTKCSRMGWPEWSTRTLVVRSLIRRHWIEKVDPSVAEEWKATWAMSETGKAALEEYERKNTCR